MNAADPKVVQALQQATLLELFALSTLIDRLMADPARLAQIRLRLHLGQAVRFLDWRHPQMPLRSAKVVALAKDHASVLEDGANRQWNLPYAAIEPFVSSPTAATTAAGKVIRRRSRRLTSVTGIESTLDFSDEGKVFRQSMVDSGRARVNALQESLLFAHEFALATSPAVRARIQSSGPNANRPEAGLLRMLMSASMGVFQRVWLSFGRGSSGEPEAV